MKRLTLDEAIGQTLQAKVTIGENTLLRFTDGIVKLYTNFESYEISDYTDGDDPLENLQSLGRDAIDELQAAGFIDAAQKAAAVAQREEDLKAYDLRREADLRKQYESLKARFEPQPVADPCSGCGSDVETPGLDKLCPGCQKIEDDARREALSDDKD